MKVSAKKRFLAWTIAFLMVFTYVPATAYATDDVNANAGAEAAAVQTDAVEDVTVDVDTAKEDADSQVEKTEEKPVVASEETMTSNANDTGTLADIDILDGKVSVYNSKAKGSVSNGVVTITAPGGMNGTAVTNVVYVYNKSGKEANISFDYHASNYSSFNKSNDDGTYNDTLEAGGSVMFTITGAETGSNNTAVLTLSNFSIKEVADASEMTFSYDSELGSITVAGETVADGAVQTVTYGEGVKVAAEPVSGAKFLGWINKETGRIYSREAEYTLKPSEDVTVEAVFTGDASPAYFIAGEKYLTSDFDAAAKKAARAEEQTMILMNDAELTSGTYTVPAKVTFVIPFDDDNTIYTTAPKATHGEYAKPKAYRTLTLGDGAELVVNGKLSLPAKHNAASGSSRASGAPTGDVSLLKMNKGSSITVNDGAALYAYGYIIGEGSVLAKAGATVYELFQIEDFRGGTATSDMAVDNTLVDYDGNKSNHGVLPLSQYYVQNIEVPMTLQAGAIEYTYTSVYMSDGIYGAAIAFISKSNAMFNLTDGYVTKAYDGSKDRLNVEANGTMSLSPIEVEISKDSKPVDSSDFELPINSNITVKVNSGDVEINQDIALLPGAEIIIESGATCTLEENSCIYVYDSEQWGGYTATNKKFLPVSYAPGRTYNRQESDLVDASIQVDGILDASKGYVYTTTNSDFEIGYGNIFSTKNGKIYSMSGYEGATYQVTQNGTDVTYQEINLLPANLVNADGSYLMTLDEEGKVATYTYTNGIWLCDHERLVDEITDATCTEEGSQHIECKMEHEYNMVLPPKGHTKLTDPAKAPTCTESGVTEGSHCRTCGEVLVAQKDIPKLGHTEVVDKAVPASCETDGLTEGKHCSVCNDILVAQKLDKAKGHEWSEPAGKAPTCTEDGYGSTKCKNCTAELKDETIPALGHDYKWTVTTPAECEKAGEEEGVCQRADCGHETTREIEATGHSFKNYVDNKDAACDKAGTATAECENGCGATKDKDTDALGHIWKTDNEKNPVYEVDVKPTCTEKGSESVHCERCDASNPETTREIAATGHTEETIKAIAPTCDKPGATAGVKCSVCGTVTKAPDKLSSLGGHKWSEVSIIKLPGINEKTTFYESGTILHKCENDGCTERKETTVDWGEIKSYDEFIESLEILENWAFDYSIDNPGNDPAALVIRYVRTGVDRYNSGSWQFMSGVDNKAFADFVSEKEIKINESAESEADKINVTGLKNIENFVLKNGDYVDFGHMFGTMDITYTNKNSIKHADVAGWAGDTADLLSISDRKGVTGTVEEMTAAITEKYLMKDFENEEDKFGYTDMLGDLDGYYITRELLSQEYEKGLITDIAKKYFTESLTEKQRAEYFFENRLQCGSSRDAVREAIYVAYRGNDVITTLEGTREFVSSGEELENLRRAACNAVADYICKLAGDYVNIAENEFYDVFSAKYSTLAPGITQEIKLANTTDDKVLSYYIATADLRRDDVHVYANYGSRPVEKDENGNYIWCEARVMDQMYAAQEKYSNPENEEYIKNYKAIAGINGDGYTMGVGTPGGLLIMDGTEYHGIGKNGFFGILEDGTAVIGTTAEYNSTYKGKLKEAIGGFGTTLVKNGEVCISADSSYYTDRGSRTAVGITRTGKVVFMVLDGRQQDSAGGSMAEIAQIMMEAGCVEAINLDGGGSTTYVAKQEGDEELSLVNKPSDGFQRSVATTLMMVSTAASSTEFSRATLETPTNYMTVGSEMKIIAKGVSATGNAVDIPEGAVWKVSNEEIVNINEDGVLTAIKNGEVDVELILNNVPVGQKRISVVVPDKITFTKSSVDAVYDAKVTLPIKAYYFGKAVTVNANDFEYKISIPEAGKMVGLDFVAAKDTGIRRIDITANVKGVPSVAATIEVALYKQGENSFDFDQKTDGTRTFAWLRTVSNSTTTDNKTYRVDTVGKNMETSYTFAIDMTQIPIPEELEDLTYMLPGSDVEGACAWTFLCNLAQRISDITEVTATVQIDENLEVVDYKNIEVINEYFELVEDGVTYNKDTNTLILKMNWIRQPSPIDVDMANPLCLVNNILLAPKADASWDANKSINVINSGTVSYKVYMRATSLYSFAEKPENAIYKLTPYINEKYVFPDGTADKGAWFGDTYTQFTDTYTLVNDHKNGWFTEDGGHAYYKDGVRCTGVNKITEKVNGVMTSLYYDFGENGINMGKKTYTGLVENDDHTYSYAENGMLKGGWVIIDGEHYYFANDTKKALPGKHKIKVTGQNQIILDWGGGRDYQTITQDVEFDFDKTGKVKNGGVWHVNTDDGMDYFYYGNGFYCRQWYEWEGKTYFFGKTGYAVRGLVQIKEHSTKPAMVHMFDEETGEWIQMCEGFVNYESGGATYTYYYPTEAEREAGVYAEEEMYKCRLIGFRQLDGKYYLFSDKGVMKKGTQKVTHDYADSCTTLTFDKTNGYAVDNNGKPRTDLKHIAVTDKAVAATCGKTGLTAGSHCGECGVVMVAQKKTPIKEKHSYGTKKYATPTTKASGGYYQKCAGCGHVKWITKQTYTQYVKANVPKTTVKVKVTGSRKTETITVKWTTSTKAPTYFKVQRATKKNGKYKTLTSKAKGNSYVDKTAKVGQTYYYKVTGYAKSGKTYSTKVSNKASTKIVKTTKKYVQGSSMKATVSYGKKALVVKWTAPRIKAGGYEIYRATSKNGTYKKIGTRKSTSLSYTDKNVKVGKRYYYKVRAYKKISGKKVYTKYSPKVNKTARK